MMDDTFEEPQSEMTDSDILVHEETFSPAPSTQEHTKNSKVNLYYCPHHFMCIYRNKKPYDYIHYISCYSHFI